MPRFFFHVRAISSAYDDGEVLQGRVAAASRAKQIACELAGEGDVYRDYEVIALDEPEKEIARCAIALTSTARLPP